MIPRLPAETTRERLKRNLAQALAAWDAFEAAERIKTDAAACASTNPDTMCRGCRCWKNHRKWCG